MSFRDSLVIHYDAMRAMPIWSAALHAYLISERIASLEDIELAYQTVDREPTDGEKKGIQNLKDGWMILPMAKVKRDIGMSFSRQRKSLENLKTLGLADSRVSGCPPKRWVWVNYKGHDGPKDRGEERD